MRATWSRFIAISGLVALIAGCSTFKLGYYFADNLIVEKAEDYLNLEGGEKTILARQVAELVSWHRTVMLPQYADFLEAQAHVMSQGRWTMENVTKAFEDYRSLMASTVEGASPFLANILVRHSTGEKFVYLQARLEQALSERLVDEMQESRSEAVEEWIERHTTNLERFLGDLNAEQVGVLESFALKDAFGGLRWIEHRTLRQAALLSFLAEQPDADELADFLPRLIVRGYDIVDPDYKQISAQRWAVREALYHGVLNRLTEDQRQEATERLRSYAQDMRELASKTANF